MDQAQEGETRLPFSQDLRILALLKNFNLLEARLANFQCCNCFYYNGPQLSFAYLQKAENFVDSAGRLISLARDYLARLPGCDPEVAKVSHSAAVNAAASVTFRDQRCECFDWLEPRLRSLEEYTSEIFEYYPRIFCLGGFRTASSVEELEKEQAEAGQMLEWRSELICKNLVLIRQAARRCKKNHSFFRHLNLCDDKSCYRCDMDN